MVIEEGTSWVVIVKSADSDYPYLSPMIVNHSGLSQAQFMDEFDGLFPDLELVSIHEDFEVDFFTLEYKISLGKN